MTDIGLLVLRAVLGLIFMAHGSQKTFGWFGGPGPKGTAGFVGGMGFKPAWFWAALVAYGEFLGGVSVLLGLATPLGALLIVSSMTVAIAKVHWTKGFWLANGGYEFNLILIAAAVAVALVGPGSWSLDHVWGIALLGR